MIILIILFFSHSSFACPNENWAEKLQEISFDNIQASLTTSRWGIHRCSIRTTQTVNQAVKSKTWEFTDSKLESVIEHTTYSDPKNDFSHKNIVNRTHDISIEYNVKNPKVLAEFKKIKNKFSRKNLEICSKSDS